MHLRVRSAYNNTDKEFCEQNIYTAVLRIRYINFKIIPDTFECEINSVFTNYIPPNDLLCYGYTDNVVMEAISAANILTTGAEEIPAKHHKASGK